MATVNEAKPATKSEGKARDRSPSFPFIPLQTAIERLEAFERYFKRHPGPINKAGLAWDMKEKSSQSTSTLAALKSYGLIDYQGAGNDRVAVLSEDGRTYLRAQQDGVKAAVLKRAALRPSRIAKYFALWGVDRPPDPVCLDELVLKGRFSDNGAQIFLKVYDATIACAKLVDSDKRPVSVMEATEDNGEDDGGVVKVKIGDYVQWSPGGVEQFQPPRQIEWISDDGRFARAFGSPTGMPLRELTVVPAPMAAMNIRSGGQEEDDTLVATGTKNPISIYLTPNNRLQITADVDEEGLERLLKMLNMHQELLKML